MEFRVYQEGDRWRWALVWRDKAVAWGECDYGTEGAARAGAMAFSREVGLALEAMPRA